MDKPRPSRAALAENFNALTKDAGGVGAVAKMLNIGSGTVGRIKACDVVQTDTLEKIADHYHVAVHELLMPKLGAGLTPFRDLNAEEAGVVTMFRAIKSAEDRRWILNALATANMSSIPRADGDKGEADDETQTRGSKARNRVSNR